MKRLTYALGIFLSILVIACNDNSGTTVDEGTSDTSNANTSTGTTDTAASSATTTPATFDAVMSKMMQDMHSMTMTNDVDHDFAMMMKRHHEGAIEMANMELSNGTNAELKQAAQKMIDDARKDNTELTDFLGKHQASSGNSDYAKKAMDIMMKGSSMNHTGNTDQQFAVMMAMHHQHGIDMSKEYLKLAKEQQTKKVANNTIKSNSEDLKVLKNWKSNNKSDTTGHSGH